MDVGLLEIFIFVLFGLVAGSGLPVTIAYLAAFCRKRKSKGFKLIIQLILRLFLIWIIYGIIGATLMGIWNATHTAGLDFNFENEEIFSWYMRGFSTAFFGGLIMLLVGFWLGKKRRTSKTQKSA